MSGPVSNAPDGENVTSVGNPHGAQTFRRHHVNAQFLEEFTLNSLARCFAGFNMSARKAPTTTLGDVGCPANGQISRAAAKDADHTATNSSFLNSVGLTVSVRHQSPGQRIVLSKVRRSNKKGGGLQPAAKNDSKPTLAYYGYNSVSVDENWFAPEPNASWPG